MTNSPVVRVMTPATLKSIVSPAVASIISCRSDPAPLSYKLDTLIVVAACATGICPALKASTKSSPARNQIRFSVAVFVIRYYSQGVVGTPIFYHVRPVGSAARQAV